MEIELVLHKDRVQVIFRNTGSTELRLWELWNSWGFWSLSFQIRDVEESNISTVLHRWNEEWTVNGPTTFVIAPGETHEITENLNDGEWMREYHIMRLKNKPLQVRAAYNVYPLNPEELKFLRGLEPVWLSEIRSVFTGTLASDWVASNPPHDWLFAETPYWTKTKERLSTGSLDEVLRKLTGLVNWMTRDIESNAKALDKDKLVSLPVTKLASTQSTTVGHHVNTILESILEIQKAVKEVSDYLDGKNRTNGG